MEFDLEYKLQLFREEQPELFDAKGKRYTGTVLSNRTAEMMFELINELESALENAETGENNALLPDVSNRRELLIGVLSKLYDLEILTKIEVTEIERRIDNANL